MATTRGLAEALNVEKKISTIFDLYGAKLVEAHGRLAYSGGTGTTTPVPPGTVVMFLATPGQCMYIPAGRSIANKFFYSTNTLRNQFFKGKTNIHHVADILTRTYLPGDPLPNTNLQFYDKDFPGYGYVWKLPLGDPRAIVASNMTREGVPARGSIYTTIKHGPYARYTLAQVLNELGPGVYIINACLLTSNSKIHPIDAPRVSRSDNYFGRPIAPRRTREYLRYQRIITKPQRTLKPGTVRRTVLPKYKELVKPTMKFKGGLSVSEFLEELNRRPNTMDVNKLRPNVNTNLNKIRATIKFMKKPQTFLTGLSLKDKLKFLYSKRRAQFIHSRLP